MPALDIVDQSNNNGALTSFDGLTGYAHKMSEGHTFYDKYAAGRLRAASDAGLRYVIGYHVLRAGTTSGTDQANYYLDCCVEAGFDPSARGSITMNDWEGWSDGFATRTQAFDFAARVNNLTGRESVIHYGGLPNPYDMGDNIWLADYRTEAVAKTNRLWPRAAVWQWGNKANGGGDTNQIIDAAWLDHLAGYDHPIEPEEDVALTAQDKADIQTIVFNVCLGLWREPEMKLIIRDACAAALAALPAPPASALTPQQVTDACAVAIKTQLEQTTYLSVPQFP